MHVHATIGEGHHTGHTVGMSSTGRSPRWSTAHLLVATPPLDDPNFDRTVVFMLEHNADGAIGVVLNRPAAIGLPDTLDRWSPHLTTPARLFHGGPVELDALVALAEVHHPVDPDWTPVLAGVASIDLRSGPDDVGDISRLRVFRGYAGWGPGQLDDELDAGAWMVVPAEADDVFCTDPAPLWRAVVRRQGGRTAWVANAPDDLRAN